MSTLHFDTDAGRGTSNLIATTASNLNSELNNVSQRVNSMVGAEWQGNSANQFHGEFEQWANQLRNTISQLEQLKQRLDAEIADWEQAAASLS